MAVYRDIDTPMRVNGDLTLTGSYNLTVGGNITEGGALLSSKYASKLIDISAGSGLAGGGALSGNITISHGDTSSQGNVSVSGAMAITGINLDAYGHITTISTSNINSMYSTDDRDIKPDITTKARLSSYFTSLQGLTGASGASYQDLLVMNTYTDNSGGKVNALAFDKSGMIIRHYQANQVDTTWGTPKILSYDDHNHDATYLGISGTATDSNKLDGLDSLQFIRADTDFVATGTIRAKAIGNDNNGLYIPFPHGGSLQTMTATLTGAIKITLPVSWTSTMLRFSIDIYDYTTNEAFTVHVGGYNYIVSASWSNNPSAYIIGNNINRDFTVRFGHDGTKCCIYIGELASTWSYPQIRVKDFVAGYSNYNFTSWDEGWSVGFEATAFGTITATISDCMVKSSYAKNSGLLNGQSASYYATSTHNHDTTYLPISGTAVDSSKLGGLGSSQFLRSDIASTIAGKLTISTGGLVVNSGGIDSESTILYGITASKGRLSYGTTGLITLEAVSINTSIDLKATGTGSVKINGNTAYHAGNFVPTQYVKNDTAGQSVLGNFTVNGDGNIWVGTTANDGTDGDIHLRNNAGSNTIQLDGQSDSKTSGVQIYISGAGHIEMTGTLTANKIVVTDTIVVTNLNAEMVGGKKEKQIAKNESIYELGGKGVYTELNTEAQSVPNMTVKVNAGTVYTNTGMRVVLSTQNVSVSTASATYTRIDVIYIKGSSDGTNEGTLGIATGTPASTPIEPSIPSDAVKLSVLTIPANLTSIQNSHIADARVWKPVSWSSYADNKLFVKDLKTQSISGDGNLPITINHPLKANGWAITFQMNTGLRDYTWTHNLNLSNYAIHLSCNSPEPHVYWSDKTVNSIRIWFDDISESNIQVDAVITAL